MTKRKVVKKKSQAEIDMENGLESFDEAITDLQGQNKKSDRITLIPLEIDTMSKLVNWRADLPVDAIVHQEALKMRIDQIVDHLPLTVFQPQTKVIEVKK